VCVAPPLLPSPSEGGGSLHSSGTIENQPRSGTSPIMRGGWEGVTGGHRALTSLRLHPVSSSDESPSRSERPAALILQGGGGIAWTGQATVEFLVGRHGKPAWWAVNRRIAGLKPDVWKIARAEVAVPLKRLRNIPYWLSQAESPVITGGSVEFSTRPKRPISENDAFVVLRGLQPKAPPL
jgi:hypothetical protein